MGLLKKVKKSKQALKQTSKYMGLFACLLTGLNTLLCFFFSVLCFVFCIFLSSLLDFKLDILNEICIMLSLHEIYMIYLFVHI